MVISKVGITTKILFKIHLCRGVSRESVERWKVASGHIFKTS